MATTYTELFRLPKHEITDPFDITLINDSMDIIEKALGARSRVFNLLDNSDFRNPVNQRGLTSYTGTGGKVYTIDRWYTWSPYISVTLQDGYVSITNSSDNEYQQLTQSITSHKMTGKAITLAVWDAEGGVHCASGTLVQGTTISYVNSSVFWLSVSLDANGDITVSLYPRVGQTVQIKHVALYPGAYTADTLPEYQPKGYAAELAECMRYYIRYTTDTDSMFLPGGSNHNTLYATLHLPVPMRIDSPTVKYNNVNLYAYIAGSAITINGMTAPSNSATHGFVTLRVTHDTNAIAGGAPGCIRILAGGYIELSADL